MISKYTVPNSLPTNLRLKKGRSMGGLNLYFQLCVCVWVGERSRATSAAGAAGV